MRDCDIIDLSKERPRLLARRAERALPSEVLALAVVCAWPISMALFFGMSAIEASRAMWGRR